MYTRVVILGIFCAASLIAAGCADPGDFDGPQDDVEDGPGDEEIDQTQDELSGKGREFAAAAERTAASMPGTGRCMLGVRQALESVPGVPDFRRFGSAYQWGDYYENHIGELNARGLTRRPMNILDAPPGSVIVYGRGMCGRNAEHGHIEIAVGGGRACSDYCRQMPPCGPAKVFPPL